MTYLLTSTMIADASPLQRFRVICRLMMKEFFRNRFAIFTMLLLPIFTLVIAFVATKDVLMLVALDSGEVISISMLEVHVVTATLTGIAIMTAMAGFYITISSAKRDRRLFLSGYRAIHIVGAKALICGVVLLAGSSLVYSLTVLFVSPKNHLIAYGAVLLVGFVYVFLGILVGSLVPREFEGSLLVLLISFIDTMLITNPMSSGSYRTLFSKMFPGYSPVQIMLEATFTPPVSNLVFPTAGSLLYTLVLGIAALWIFCKRNKIARKGTLRRYA
ncbi:MAG: ABC transporter permease [Candidatus Heimdallarchaeota archaeon]